MKRFEETWPYNCTGYHAFEPPLPWPHKICYCDSCKQGYIIATNLFHVNFKNDKIQAAGDKFRLFLKMRSSFLCKGTPTFCQNQVVVLSQHRVSSFKTVRPVTPRCADV